MASISIRNINKSFGTVKVLHDINLEIRDGEFISLLGSSGCGKSTLLRIIAGLEQETGGELLIGERTMDKVPPKNRSVSMVFQSYALYPHLSVYDNMSLPLVMRKLSRIQRLPLVGRMIGGAGQAHRKIREKVVALAKSLDIDSLLDRNRRNSRAVSASVWPWEGQWCANPRYSSWMNLSQTWTPRCAPTCGLSSRSCIAA